MVLLLWTTSSRQLGQRANNDKIMWEEQENAGKRHSPHSKIMEVSMRHSEEDVPKEVYF